MSDQNEEIMEEEDDEVSNILSYKTAKYLVLFLLVVLIVGFIISFVDFKKHADKGDHAKYFWVELNIPKDHPDTVYQEKIIYIDSAAMRLRDSMNAHDAMMNSGATATPAAPVQAAAPPPPPTPAPTPVATAPAPARKERPASTAAPAPPSEPPSPPRHATDDEKSAIATQIENIEKVNNMKAEVIEIGHVYHSNGNLFMQDMDEFLKGKGYKTDGGNGSRMLFGDEKRKGYWVYLKPGTKHIVVGVGQL